MSHPCDRGHQYLFEQIVEHTEFLGDYDMEYYASEPVSIQSILNMSSGIADLADLVWSLDPDDDAWAQIANSNVIYAKANVGNTIHIIEEVMAYLDGDIEKDYFGYSTLIKEKILAMGDDVYVSTEDFILGFKEGHPADIQTFIFGLFS